MSNRGSLIISSQSKNIEEGASLLFESRYSIHKMFTKYSFSKCAKYTIYTRVRRWFRIDGSVRLTVHRWCFFRILVHAVVALFLEPHALLLILGQMARTVGPIIGKYTRSKLHLYSQRMSSVCIVCKKKIFALNTSNLNLCKGKSHARGMLKLHALLCVLK